MTMAEIINDGPLSSPQRGIWFDQIRHADAPLYNVGGYVRIDGAVNPYLIEKAINRVIQENDALRTVFHEDTPLPVQTFKETVDVKVDCYDFSAEQDPHQHAIQWMENELGTPFQLYGHILFKFALIKVSEECYYGFGKYHHLIIDGWGLSLFFQRVAKHYEALVAGDTSDDGGTRYPYVDFVQDDKNYLDSEAYKRHEQYWQQKYHDLPEPLIPYRYAAQFNGIVPSHRQTLTLTWDFYQRLITFAKNNKATTFHLFIGVLYCYFIRTTEAKDFVIGLPVLNRKSAAFQRTIGLFTGVIPARFRFETELTFIELMQAISTELYKEYRRQRFPLGDINKLAGLHKVSRGQLFDMTLSYQKNDFLTTFAGNPAKVLTLPNGFEQSALAIAVEEYQENQNIRLTFDYNLGAFDDAEIERIIARVECLLGEVLERPAVPIRDLNLMPEDERHKILFEFNDTAVSYPFDKTIVDLFEEQVEKTPHNVAVVFENQQLTYQELNSRANQLAHHLQTLGVKPEVLVGICVERSLDMVIGLLGILKAGGAYVPLDPNYPPERLAFMLADSQVQVLLTLQPFIERHSSPIKDRFICLDTDWKMFSNAGTSNPVSCVQPDNLAYVIYTSGSTGKPKGVMISHHSVVNFLSAMRQSPGLTEQDILLAVTTISFDIAVLELYLPLLVGAKVVLVSREIASDGLQLLKRLNNSGATVMQATPATWRMLLTAGEKDHFSLKSLIGGEALPRQLAHQLLEKGAEVWNLYGPTETTVWSACYPVAKAPLTGLTCDTESIGGPIANTQIYILDQHHHPVPMGVAGELYISGVGLARGYLNRPELTEEKFIPNPFINVELESDNPKSTRLYKTGDLARYFPDGKIEYLGRIDHQVKMRGFRIELGEIEAVLIQHPHVMETAVIIQEEGCLNKRLVAYFVSNLTLALIPSYILRDFLKEKLPDYMLPSFFIELEALPLTPNGKVDRRALVQLSINSCQLPEETFVAPRTPEEELLAGIWAEILDVEQVGIHDNFFELGGHSLLATQVMSRIRDTFSCELPLRHLFESPTVSSLVAKIGTEQFGKTAVPPIPVIERAENLPLSFAQQRLWFLNQLEGGRSATYNMPAAVRLLGALHFTALEQSLTEMVQRHETLRTTFPRVEDGSPIQNIHQLEGFSYQLSVTDLQSLAAEEQATEAQRLTSEEAQRPFDLAEGPLFRTTLLRVGPQEHVLLLTMHHIISDGWSIGVFVRDFVSLYKAFSQGGFYPLMPLPIQYADFAHWQRQWLTGEVLETQINYWQQQLAGSPALLELPTDHPRPAIQTFRGSIQLFEINQELTKELKQIGHKDGATLFMTLLSAFVILLYRYSGQEDIVVGSPIANRNRSEVESLIGLFVNTLVLRTHLSGNKNFIDLLNQVRKVSLEAYAHQDIPLEQLLEALQPERNLSHSPLFQVMFVLQNAPREQLELSGLSLSVLDRESVTAKFDLTLFLEETEQGLKGSLEYNTDLFNADTIDRMAGHFQILLAGIVANSTQSIAELPLLTKAEQHQLLIEWNDTTVAYPDDLCIHQLFEAQVENTPDAVAVVFEEQQLTYQELNVRANQLAHHLQTLGVKPEVLVGICVERSLEMVIGLLGILKAGGAYLPLDPAYPLVRLAFMLEDAKVSVLLTQLSLKEKLPSHQASMVCLDSDWRMISRLVSENLDSSVQSENLAYVIYTSGSTGKPKGAMNTHHGICNRLLWMQDAYQLTAADSVLQKTPFSFDVSVWEFFWPLIVGARLVVAKPSGHQDSAYLVKLIVEQNITTLHFVPAMLQIFVQEPGLENCKSLKRVICSGEALPFELQERFFARSFAQLHNLYGPTEAAVDVTYWMCQRESKRPIVPIGRPITNTQVYILDRYQNPTPIGVSGELYIGGAGLARGYFNRPELTAEKFISNPFSSDPEARLYKTGDLVRYLSDGNIEYLGRLDHQVKIRGFRIELGEIEALLSQHPNVRESVVIAREDQPGNKRIVAYFVSDLVPERIPYQSECIVELDGKTLKLRTEDISGNGVCLQQDDAVTLKEGNEISLHLLLPNESEARWLPGKIVWSRASWAGVEFTLTPSEQALIDRSVEYLLEYTGLLKVVQRLLVGNMRRYLEEKLPNYMVPAQFVLLSALPLTPNGKVDRRALPAPDKPSYSLKKEFMPQTEMENQIAAVWQEVLQIKKVGIYDHFFEIGGHSLLIAQVQSKLQNRLGIELPMVELFEYPTIHALAEHLSEKRSTRLPQSQPQTKKSRRTRPIYNEIAIIGMAGRFPGAKDLETFWQNLRDGVESIAFFKESEMVSSGIDTTTLSQPNYVKAGGVLSDVEWFGATFFDFSPKEAELMDPQHRLFLECAWQAIENAAIAPGTDEYAIGVYAGVGVNTYLLNNLYPHQKFSGSVGNYQLMIGNGNDFLPTRVSYKLNLKGPSVDVQTACSTSLVAVHSACQSLLDEECDIALAGGVSIRVPHKTGYLYEEGMIYSPDGHCRAFDARAQGTVGGNGVGVVVLKRLGDAIADGDNIHAIIKGSAINNDGSMKVGYTAPSIEGQAAVISDALNNARIEPETISYIETHGTGTKLGDPIEVAALSKAFQSHSQKQGFCAIGSVKTNIGHTDTAAGVAGLIKTVLALKHQALPASLHFEQANPQIDFANSPFYVNTSLSEWKTSNGTPRRAGVSSFGIGGTNAHVVLEEALIPEPSEESRPWQLLVLSAKTNSALETATANLAMYLEQHPDTHLVDVAYTLSKGRKSFSHRRMLVCQDTQEAKRALRIVDPKYMLTGFQEQERPVVFMFSGQGTQYVNMGLELYQTEAFFREDVDLCAEYLKAHLELDIRQVLYPSEDKTSEATLQLNQTAIAQPALFVIEYALANLWMEWGVQPQAMIGHSIGEYVAACLSGVFSLEEALALVAARGRLMQLLPSGAMLAVSLSDSEVQPLLSKELSLAAINAPSLCVVSGVTEAVETLENQLIGQGVECRRLHTSHAFHSQMMEPILGAFTDLVKQVRLCAPQIPYLSNVTGTWLTVEDTLNHGYWANHLRHTVRFADGMQQLLKKPQRILLEIGPGRTLSTLVRRHSDKAPEQVVLSSLRHPIEPQQSDVGFLLNTLGKLWLAGGHLDWSGFYAYERRHRLPLPSYPFERQRYWVEPPKTATQDKPLQLWQSVVATSHKQAQQGISAVDNPTYQAKKACLDRLCLAYMGKALKDLGVFSKPGEKYSLEVFVTQFNIQPSYQQLLYRWLQVLVEQGQLQQDGEYFTNLQLLTPEAFKVLVEDSQVKWADERQMLESVQRCGDNLASVLTGEQEPLALLFPATGFDAIESRVQESPFVHYYNTILQSIVQQVVKFLPQSGHLNVLEIGAGMGYTTVALLPMLPPQQTRYTFTDVGRLFLNRAQQKFSEYPFVQYRLLDIEQSPQEQGYEHHSCDIVIAANVLHVTLCIKETLAHVRSLLAPSGLLLIWEITQPQFTFDITDGLLMNRLDEGDRNQGNPFLSKEQWSKELRNHGFVEVATLPKTNVLGHHILVAQADSAGEQTVPYAFTDLQGQKEPVSSPLIHTRPELGHTYTAPRNETELKIVDIWQQFLGIEQVGIHDNFFELGGDSLIAVQLLAKLRETLQTDLSAHSLLKAPTIAALAEFIEKTTSVIELSNSIAQPAQPSLLVEIKMGNSLKQPLFLIHPAGGNVYYYRDLAHYLDSDRPVYGIQAQGLEGETEPLTRIEEMATQYIKALRILQPEGPYFLGGSSLGGTVAFEMAQQLHALGQQVALLTMIDTPGPGQMPVAQFVDDAEIIAYLLEVGANVSVSLDELRKMEKDELLSFIEQMKIDNRISLDLDMTQFCHFLHLFKVNLQAMLSYTPRVYPGRIIFFRAKERDTFNAQHPEQAWLELAGKGIEIYVVPGNHLTMNSPPHVQFLAERLRDCLEQVC
jgi:amino acid adenylation domain-containing protein